MNYPSNGAVSRDSLLNPLLMNVQNSPSEVAGLASNYPQVYVPSSFAIKHSEDKDDSLEWAADNLTRLVSEYPDKWIVVKNRNVVEVSDDLIDLLKRASRAGIVKPLVLKMEQLPKRKWRTVF